jgi:group I intron endonuclease
VEIPKGAACLYKITFPNGKVYIGVTSDFERRMRAHAKSGITPLHPVNRAVAKFGWENVKTQILAIGPQEYIYDLESLAILNFVSLVPYGYNASCGGPPQTSMSGLKHSEETKRKISRARIGAKFSDEHRKNLSIAHLGQARPWTDESRQKLSASRKGIKFTDAHKEKLRQASLAYAASKNV